MKALLMIFATLLFATSGYAQEDFEEMNTTITEVEAGNMAPDFGRASFSPSFGIVASSFGGGDTSGVTTGVGFSVGLDVYVPTSSSYIDYMTGLFFTRNQWQTRDFDVNGSSIYSYNADTSVDRLSIPVRAKIFPFTKSSGFYSKAGLVANFFLAGETKWSESEIDTSLGQSSVSISDSGKARWNTELVNPLVVDAALGIGYEGTIGRSFAYFAEVNYQYGLSSFSKNSNVRIDTTAVSFGVGF